MCAGLGLTWIKVHRAKRAWQAWPLYLVLNSLGDQTIDYKRLVASLFTKPFPYRTKNDRIATARHYFTRFIVHSSYRKAWNNVYYLISYEDHYTFYERRFFHAPSSSYICSYFCLFKVRLCWSLVVRRGTTLNNLRNPPPPQKKTCDWNY